jgi:hypothetical protein
MSGNIRAPRKGTRTPSEVTPRVEKAARELFNAHEGVAKVNPLGIKPEESKYRVCIECEKPSDVTREFKSALGKALTDLGITDYYVWSGNVKRSQVTTGRRVITIKHRTKNNCVFYSLHEVPKQRFD